MCINDQGKTFKSVWDMGPVPSPQKKKKKKRSDFMETGGNEAFTRA